MSGVIEINYDTADKELLAIVVTGATGWLVAVRVRVAG